MLPGKQLSGILGLLLSISFPEGIIVLLLGLVKVAEMVGWGAEEIQASGIHRLESWKLETV